MKRLQCVIFIITLFDNLEGGMDTATLETIYWIINTVCDKGEVPGYDGVLKCANI